MIVQPGVTFAVEATGPVGLVPADRPVQLVLSRGSLGYGPGGAFDGWDYQEPYLRGILKFIGLTDVRSILVEGTAYGPQVADPALEHGLAQATEAASKFAPTSTPDRTMTSVT